MIFALQTSDHALRAVSEANIISLCGVGAKYTRSHGPCTLVYTEGPYEYGHALSREAAIKKMTKEQKERLLDTTNR